ncbi:hypothetical protein EDD86DRAFT_246665 [Gorgonomyces haynaldii]|nr:hypothetical protein EDD86DRAFT_246665 [Gorgonomyces haynaldii]
MNHSWENLNEDYEEYTPEAKRERLAIVKPWKETKAKLEELIKQQSVAKAVEYSDEDGKFAALNVSMPQGVNLLRTLGNPRTKMRSALYMPVTTENIIDRYACHDGAFAYIWDKTEFTQKTSIKPVVFGGGTDLAALTQWIYLRRWRCLLFVNPHTFEAYSTFKVPAPIVSLREHDEKIIVGCVGIVYVWELEKTPTLEIGPVQLGQQLLKIEDLDPNDWISNMVFNDKRQRVFSMETGERVHHMGDIHDSSISCLLYIESLQYLITGSTDASIKVWDASNQKLFEFNDHSQTITGLGEVLGLGDKATSCFISSSMDTNIRVWNLETGECIHRVETGHAIYGIEFLKDTTFLACSEGGMLIFNLDRLYHTFNNAGSKVIDLERNQFRGMSGRLVSVSFDGSLGILSPRTADKIIVGFPTVSNLEIVSHVYDRILEKFYMLTNTGSVLVYSSATNPASLAGEWKSNLNDDQMLCLTGLVLKTTSKVQFTSPSQYALFFAGTKGGQIVQLDIRREGMQHTVVQAHTGSIEYIRSSNAGDFIFTSSLDGSVKIWQAKYSESPGIGGLPLSEATFQGRNRPIFYTLMLYGTININKMLGLPMNLHYNPKHEMLVVSTSRHCIFMFQKNGNVFIELERHAEYEEHSGTIHTITSNDFLGIFCTTSTDGTLKIWDTTNNLIREIVFDDSIYGAAFLNDQADLVVSLGNELVIIYVQDYLPLTLCKQLLKAPIQDDSFEESKAFDTQAELANPVMRKKLKNKLRTILEPENAGEKTYVKYKNLWGDEDEEPVKEENKKQKRIEEAVMEVMQEVQKEEEEEIEISNRVEMPEMDLDNLMKRSSVNKQAKKDRRMTVASLEKQEKRKQQQLKSLQALERARERQKIREQLIADEQARQKAKKEKELVKKFAYAAAPNSILTGEIETAKKHIKELKELDGEPTEEEPLYVDYITEEADEKPKKKPVQKEQKKDKKPKKSKKKDKKSKKHPVEETIREETPVNEPVLVPEQELTAVAEPVSVEHQPELIVQHEESVIIQEKPVSPASAAESEQSVDQSSNDSIRVDEQGQPIKKQRKEKQKKIHFEGFDMSEADKEEVEPKKKPRQKHPKITYEDHDSMSEDEDTFVPMNAPKKKHQMPTLVKKETGETVKAQESTVYHTEEPDLAESNEKKQNLQELTKKRLSKKADNYKRIFLHEAHDVRDRRMTLNPNVVEKDAKTPEHLKRRGAKMLEMVPDFMRHQKTFDWSEPVYETEEVSRKAWKMFRKAQHNKATAYLGAGDLITFDSDSDELEDLVTFADPETINSEEEDMVEIEKVEMPSKKSIFVPTVDAQVYSRRKSSVQRRKTVFEHQQSEKQVRSREPSAIESLEQQLEEQIQHSILGDHAVLVEEPLLSPIKSPAVQRKMTIQTMSLEVKDSRRSSAPIIEGKAPLRSPIEVVEEKRERVKSVVQEAQIVEKESKPMTVGERGIFVETVVKPREMTPTQETVEIEEPEEVVEKIQKIQVKKKEHKRLQSVGKTLPPTEKPKLNEMEELKVSTKSEQTVKKDSAGKMSKEQVVDLEKLIESLMYTYRSSRRKVDRLRVLKALFSIYFTFRKDIKDVLKILILPQLEFLNDPCWEVRGQCITNFVAYGIADKEIMQALIHSLQDHTSLVRVQAMQAIQYFGIGNKKELREKMIILGMMQPQPGEKIGMRELDSLDTLALEWLQHVNVRVDPQFERPNSTLITLVPHNPLQEVVKHKFKLPPIPTRIY